MTDLVLQSLAATPVSLEAVKQVMGLNAVTEQMGLSLSATQAAALEETRAEALHATGRIEFGTGISEKLILAFYTSPYLTEDNYAATLFSLTELFYQLKNETEDRIPDDELLAEMRARFDGDCHGSTELLANDAMPAFVRSLHEGTEETDG